MGNIGLAHLTRQAMFTDIVSVLILSEQAPMGEFSACQSVLSYPNNRYRVVDKIFPVEVESVM
jgi:hypothetical protein